MESLDQVIAEYKEKRASNVSQHELAEYEFRIRALRRGTGANADITPDEWFSQTFGGSQNEYKLRSTLFMAHETSEPLWERVNKGMPLRTAVQLLIDAKKKRVETNGKIKPILVELLAEYDARPGIAVTADGKIIRRQHPYSAKTTTQTNVQLDGNVGNLKQLIRSAINDHVEKVFGSTEVTYELKVAKNELFDWINDGLETFQRRVNKLRAGNKEQTLYKAIGKTRFSEACEVLALKSSDFIFGKAIPRKKMRKAYLERASFLHPDKHNGNVSEQMKNELNAVNNARDLLEEYGNQIGWS